MQGSHLLANGEALPTWWQKTFDGAAIDQLYIWGERGSHSVTVENLHSEQLQRVARSMKYCIPFHYGSISF
jgi:hypothetical protein